MLLIELERLVEIGLTPHRHSPRRRRRLRTRCSAEAAWELAVGAAASFLVLDANPLDDITHLRALHAVVLRGRLIGAEELARLRAGDVVPK